MASRLLFLVFLNFLSSGIAAGQSLWTIGPMLHINFGAGEGKSTSFTIEAAYWNLNKFPHSLDFAIEFDKGKLRLYTEAQTGIGLTGVSMGPVLQFNFKEHKTNLGFQGSCWANYILGLDYRIRFIDRKRYHAFGVYAKVPIASNGFDTSDGSIDWDDDWDDWDN